MNRMKKIMIIVISFGLIASPAIAGCILPDADFFYGVTVNAQGETSVSNGHSEADLKGEKIAPALSDDILAPDVFYGYRD